MEIIATPPTDLQSTDPALPAQIYLSRLGSEASVNGMVSSLNAVAAILTGQRDWRLVDWGRYLNAAVIETAVAMLEGAPSTKNKALAAMKGLARSAFRLNIITGECYTKIKDISGYRGSRQITGRHLETEDVGALLDACRIDRSPAGVRDTALFSVALATGARRAELASIKVEDIQDEDGLVEVNVIGKGQKERTLFVHGKAKEALDAWLELRGRSGGALFCRIAKGGRIITEHVSTTAIAKVLAKRLAQAGLEGVTMHDFRRTCAGNLLDAGASLSTASQLLGHASPQTTAKYDLRGKRARVEASRLVTVP